MTKRKRKAPAGRSALESIRARSESLSAAEPSAPATKPAVPKPAKQRMVETSPVAEQPLVPAGDSWSRSSLILTAIALVAAFVFAFWPTLVWLESQWRSEADYSHGYLVIPLSLILLWMRWETFPGICAGVDWRALWLIGVAIVMRVVGRLAYMDFMDGWSLVPMVAGIVWLLLGWPALRWASPAVLFLIMLVPLPYRAETLLSWKLQGIATEISTAMLRILGKPAIAEGHTIWIGETQLMIEQACSGLRIFVGMLALAFFWAATVTRTWLDRIVILAAALPMALLVNSLRITATGVLYGWFESAGSRHVIHDWSGYLMIPLAAGLLWLVKNYWQAIYRPVQIVNPAERLRQQSAVADPAL